VKQQGYIEAAQTLGYSKPRILFKHLVPNVSSETTAYALSDLILVILLIAGLSFLGLGAQPGQDGVHGDVGRPGFPQPGKGGRPGVGPQGPVMVPEGVPGKAGLEGLSQQDTGRDVPSGAAFHPLPEAFRQARVRPPAAGEGEATLGMVRGSDSGEAPDESGQDVVGPPGPFPPPVVPEVPEQARRVEGGRRVDGEES